MAKEIVFKDFQTEEEALYSYEAHSVSERVLDKGEKDYSGITVGNFRPLYPVLVFDVDNLLTKKGWMCQTLDKNTYKVVLNANLSKLYLDDNSDSSYFGMKYVSSDLTYSRLNEQQFKEEYLEECDRMKDEEKFSAEIKAKCINGCENIVDNLRANLRFFASLDKGEFEKELQRVVELFHFKEAKDITSYKNCLYILVFDEYKQFYVGKCVGGLKNRTRKHWNARIIPDRQLWNGGYEHSRIKVDNFKMFDTTRIFVLEDIDRLLKENSDLANDHRIEKTNTFGIDHFEDMKPLDIAERIVIINCLCKFCLSDRTPLLTSDIYEEFEAKYGCDRSSLLIKHYINFDYYKPFQTTAQKIAFLESLKERNGRKR